MSLEKLQQFCLENNFFQRDKLLLMIKKYNTDNLTVDDIKKNWDVYKQSIKLRLFNAGSYIPFF